MCGFIMDTYITNGNLLQGILTHPLPNLINSGTRWNSTITQTEHPSHQFEPPAGGYAEYGPIVNCHTANSKYSNMANSKYSKTLPPSSNSHQCYSSNPCCCLHTSSQYPDKKGSGTQCWISRVSGWMSTGDGELGINGCRGSLGRQHKGDPQILEEKSHLRLHNPCLSRQ